MSTRDETGTRAMPTAGELVKSRKEHDVGVTVIFTAAGSTTTTSTRRAIHDGPHGSASSFATGTNIVNHCYSGNIWHGERLVILSLLDPTLRTTMSKWKSDFCKI